MKYNFIFKSKIDYIESYKYGETKCNKKKRLLFRNRNR